MARRPASTQPERPTLSLLQKRRCIKRLERCISELQEFDPNSAEKRYRDTSVMRLQTAIDQALSGAFGHGIIEYRRYEDAASLDHGPHVMSLEPNPHGELMEARAYFAEGKQQSIVLLKQAIRALQDEIDDEQLEETAANPTVLPKDIPTQRKVFVVHGHDEAALHSVARFLEKLGLEAIVLREQPDAGRTIIEKFEDCAAEVGFAVVLLTPDDLGGSTSAPATTSRARQNVVFELGYFSANSDEAGPA